MDDRFRHWFASPHVSWRAVDCRASYTPIGLRSVVLAVSIHTEELTGARFFMVSLWCVAAFLRLLDRRNATLELPKRETPWTSRTSCSCSSFTRCRAGWFGCARASNEGSTMTILYAVSGFLAFALLVYLSVALLWPEKLT
jgi:K+-transporting ATPase KdpF subunit